MKFNLPNMELFIDMYAIILLKSGGAMFLMSGTYMNNKLFLGTLPVLMSLNFCQIMQK